MKLAVRCLCFLHFILLSFGLDTYISVSSRSKASHSDDPCDHTTNQSSEMRGREPAPTSCHLSAASVNQDRVRRLFARRTLYEQQKIHETKKSSIVPPPPQPQNDVSRPKAVPKPQVMARCSLLGQSCMPLCGCCDPCATCHCRFFKAICFCRRAAQARPRCGSKKTVKRRKGEKKSKMQP